MNPARSPTKPEAVVESPQPSPQHPEHGISISSYSNNRNHSNSNNLSMHNNGQPQSHASTPQPGSNSANPVPDLGNPKPESRSKVQVLPSSGSPGSGSSAPPKAARQENSDNLKSFKVSLDDPTWKVLPAALKKYRINNDNWQNYAMFICYGSPSGYSVISQQDCIDYIFNRQSD